MATMRAKRFIVNDLYTQMKSHGLTTSCTYNEYKSAVGPQNAISQRDIAKGWRSRWAVIMSQVKKQHPDIDEVINSVVPEFTFEEKVEEPKLSGLEALKSMSANKDEEDGKDF